jgi:hypothetical protein
MKQRDYSGPTTPAQKRFLKYRHLLLVVRAVVIILFLAIMVIIYG